MMWAWQLHMIDNMASDDVTEVQTLSRTISRDLVGGATGAVL